MTNEEAANTAQPAEQPESVRSEVATGDILTGVIQRIDEDHVLVDVGYKADGVIPLSELTLGPGQRPADLFEEGQELHVAVLSVDPRDGGLLLSERRARSERAWGDLESALTDGEVIKAPVIEAVKGGLIVDVGIRAFMPASHVERGYVSDLNQYVGQTVRARVIELDRNRGRAILSQKSVLEAEHEQRRRQTWASLEEGQVRTGIVKGMTEFGAFVDLGGVDGLLHVSEIAWGRIDHPADVLQEGEEITVKVLKVDPERERVSLSRKQTLADPWSEVETKYPVNSMVTGKVMRTVPFGAFVQLEPGVEGLIHISQLADRHVATPEEVVQEGQEVQVRVLRVQPEQRRISLSLRPPVEDAGTGRSSDRPRGESGSGGHGQRPPRRRDADLDSERENPPARVETERPGDGVTLGEMFGDLFEETRERLANDQRVAAGSEPDDGNEDSDEDTNA